MNPRAREKFRQTLSHSETRVPNWFKLPQLRVPTLDWFVPDLGLVCVAANFIPHCTSSAILVGATSHQILTIVC
jgi:hypothetical protein